MTPSAKLINTLYSYIASEEPGFMQKADTDELVLLSHSLGGFIAFKTLAGKAAAFGLRGMHCKTTVRGSSMHHATVSVLMMGTDVMGFLQGYASLTPSTSTRPVRGTSPC